MITSASRRAVPGARLLKRTTLSAPPAVTDGDLTHPQDSDHGGVLDHGKRDTPLDSAEDALAQDDSLTSDRIDGHAPPQFVDAAREEEVGPHDPRRRSKGLQEMLIIVQTQ